VAPHAPPECRSACTGRSAERRAARRTASHLHPAIGQEGPGHAATTGSPGRRAVHRQPARHETPGKHQHKDRECQASAGAAATSPGHRRAVAALGRSWGAQLPGLGQADREGRRDHRRGQRHRTMGRGRRPHGGPGTGRPVGYGPLPGGRRPGSGDMGPLRTGRRAVARRHRAPAGAVADRRSSATRALR
jgi:hypothetical protein